MLLENLINRPSVSPNDEGCQKIIAEYLQNLGFEITHLPFGSVSNLWARLGQVKPLFVFAGHTDVVPPGNLNDWLSPPFQATLRNGKMYGRGTADMKSAIVAMMSSVKLFLEKKQNFSGSIAFLITSDEESDAIDGTQKVVQWLKEKGEIIDYCLIGEATSEKILGDTIKVGRRGSLSGTLEIIGKQGHIAYPHLACNPIHAVLPVLNEFIQKDWDQKIIEHFSATTFQISNLHSGIGATNVIPPHLSLQFNLRYSPATSAESIQNEIHHHLNQFGLSYQLSFHHSGKPFYSEPGLLAHTLAKIIHQNLKIKSHFSTSGGTSDGRFIANISKEILEFGVINDSIHKINEHVDMKDLAMLEKIYLELLNALF